METLTVGQARRIALAASVPADARLGVPVRVVVRTPAGEPDNDANVVLTATAGRISNPMLVGDGVYSARYTPPDGRVAMEATIMAAEDQCPNGTIRLCQSGEAPVKIRLTFSLGLHLISPSLL